MRSPRWPSRLLLASNASDAAGSNLFDLALTMVAITVLGLSATELGILNALGMISFLLLAVPLGMLVDRVGARNVLLVSLISKVVIVAATLALYAAGLLTTIGMMVIATVMGVVVVATENAQTTTAPSVALDRDDTLQVVARMASADRIAGIVSPAIAGFLIALYGGLPVFGLAGALLILAVLPALGLIRSKTAANAATPKTEPTSEKDEAADDSPPNPDRFLVAAAHGFAIIWRNRTLRAITFLIAAGNIGLAIADSTLSIVILRTLDLGVEFFGILGTIAALSGLLASFIAPKLSRSVPVKRLFAGGAISQTVVASLPLLALLIPAAAHVIFIVFEVLWAVTLTVTNIAGSAYTAAAVNPQSLGRASAASRTITMGSVPIAALAGGILADTVGMPVPLSIWPALTLVAAVSFIVLTKSDAG